MKSDFFKENSYALHGFITKGALSGGQLKSVGDTIGEVRRNRGGVRRRVGRGGYWICLRSLLEAVKNLSRTLLHKLVRICLTTFGISCSPSNQQEDSVLLSEDQML